MATTISSPYSTLEVAGLVNRTDARIRQLCIAHGIGRKHGRDWLLDDDDLKKIKSLIRPEKKSD